MKELYQRDLALEWYQNGLEKNNDFLIKFMMHWIAFNWLYNKEEGASERRRIEHFCASNKDKLEKYNAFNCDAFKVFLEQPIRSMQNGRQRLDDFEGIQNRSLTSMLLTIYQVRCNLFHGSKSLRVHRDIALIQSAPIILEGYLSTILEKQ